MCCVLCSSFLSAYIQLHARPVERDERGLSYPGPSDVWGAPPSLRNIKYTRIHHFKKKNSKIFSPERSRENVFLGPTVALDGPA